MTRKLLITAGLIAAVVAVVLLVNRDGDDDSYVVRAIFDNGGYLVKAEEVRVAGANVGTIKGVDVTMPGETVAYEDGKPVTAPGKAVIELEITDPGFQDFRRDATCQIRPQSLIGEKFVDCRPTLPRAPGSEAAPPLREVPEGERGEGQHLLPLGNSGTSVDPDLINNIQRLPYAQRFRLIFNELGAGLAGRGGDLEELVKRANPVLRDVDRLFGILSAQRRELAQLAADSEAILEPLARERRAVAGFFSNAGAAAEASAERGAELEESFRKFPTFLREFRATMRDLEGFSDAATPVFEGFDEATPALTDATRTLTPFSEALTVSLKSLGEAGEGAGPVFREADPIVRKAGELAKSGQVSTRELAALFGSLEETGGWGDLVELIYNSNATLNGFDQYGHFGRSRVTLSACVEYEANRRGYEGGGCAARFNGFGVSEANTSAADLFRLLQERMSGLNGGTAAEATGPTTNLGEAHSTEGEAELGEASSATGTAGTEPLLDYLLGP